MGKSKIGTLLMSCTMMLLCVATIVGGTFALWSDSAKVENHLTAGTLKVKFERISLIKTYLDTETGYLVTTNPDTTVVDFTNTNTAQTNAFGIANNEKIVPGSSYQAKFKLTNNGDVAFNYDVIIKLTSGDVDLAKQIKIYLDDIDMGTLDTFAVDGKAIILAQTMAKNDLAKEFTIKVEFIFRPVFREVRKTYTR